LGGRLRAGVGEQLGAAFGGRVEQTAGFAVDQVTGGGADRPPAQQVVHRPRHDLALLPVDLHPVQGGGSGLAGGDLVGAAAQRGGRLPGVHSDHGDCLS
jgi:hypothetical protein